MVYEVTTAYTQELLRRANRRFLARSFGWGRAASVVLLMVIFIYQMSTGDRSWMVGGLGALLVIILLAIVAAYQVVIGRASNRFKQMQQKAVTFRFTEDTITTTSDLGTAEVPWKQFSQLWRYPDSLLLFYGKNSFIVLPISQTEEPVQTFIQRKVQENGGKIA